MGACLLPIMAPGAAPEQPEGGKPTTEAVGCLVQATGLSNGAVRGTILTSQAAANQTLHPPHHPPPCISCSSLLAIRTAMTFVTAFALQHFIAFLNDPNGSSATGIAFLLLLILSQVVRSVSNGHFAAATTVVGMNARTSLVTAIYDKLLTMPCTTSKGRVITLLSTDANRLVCKPSMWL